MTDLEKLPISRRKALLMIASVLAGAGAILDVIVSLRNSITPSGIVIHHSALPSDESLVDIEKLHVDRGFGIFYWSRIYHIGYHYIIEADGRIVPIRPEHLQGAHARGFNNMLGICVLGNFDSSSGNAIPTGSQIESLQMLCKLLMSKYRFQAADIHRHSEVDGYTVCPGDHFPFEQLLTSLRS